MSTFYGSYGTKSLFASVAINIDNYVPEDVDVHTVTLVLDGSHGEFNLTVLGTDEDGEEVAYQGIAHRSGGVQDFKRVELV
jgi:hypothetical protein